MKHFNEYSAVSFAEPYVKKTADFFCDAKERAKCKYCQEKKKIERRRRKAKIKDFIENSIGLILIIAGIIGGITAAIVIAKKCLSGSSCCGKHKIVSCSDNAEQNEEQDVQSEEKKREHKKNSGYITL